MFDRVLILAVNVGGGHMRAAQALQAAFRQLGAAREVRIADAMAYTSKLFRGRFMRAYMEVLQKVPDLYGWLYDHFDKPVECRTNRNLFEKLNTGPVLKLLEEYRPDLVISSHVLPAGIISWLRNEGRISTPHAVVVTDFDLHGMWLCDHYEHYFVALEETKLHLEALGVPSAKVVATGIPIDPPFTRKQSRIEARRQLGLHPDLPTILVTSGSWGLGPVARIVQSLQGMRSPVQVIAICALNEQLKAEVDRMIRDNPAGGPVKTTCIGWTTEMHTYMSAADLIAGKTGGLTTSEALAKGLPFLIVNPIKGQEERNADHLLEEGAAIRCNNFPVMAHKVDTLLNDPRRMARLGLHARRLGRSRAAFDIVRVLLGNQRRTAAPGRKTPCRSAASRR